MLKEFFKNLKQTDPEAVAALNAAKSEAEVMDILRSHGCEVASLEELKTELVSEGGLSDEDLEMVVGGVGVGLCIWGGVGLTSCNFFGGADNCATGGSDCVDDATGLCYGTGNGTFCVIVGC